MSISSIGPNVSLPQIKPPAAVQAPPPPPPAPAATSTDSDGDSDHSGVNIKA